MPESIRAGCASAPPADTAFPCCSGRFGPQASHAQEAFLLHLGRLAHPSWQWAGCTSLTTHGTAEVVKCCSGAPQMGWSSRMAGAGCTEERMYGSMPGGVSTRARSGGGGAEAGAGRGTDDELQGGTQRKKQMVYTGGGEANRMAAGGGWEERSGQGAGATMGDGDKGQRRVRACRRKMGHGGELGTRLQV